MKNDGWQQTLRNGTTKGRSGKLVASCSRLWNSSAHSCEFCEQQQQRAATDRRVRWNCCPSQTDVAATTSPYPGPASRPSPPDLVSPPRSSSPSRHSRRVHLPTDRGRCWELPNGRLSSIVSTAKKKQAQPCRRRRRRSTKPTHADWQEADGRKDGEVTETDDLRAAGTKYIALKN